MNAALFSSATPEWGTPQDLFNALNRRFSFTLDVCASPENAKCPHFFSKEEDGLSRPWSGRCWMNPPYGRFIGAWVEKARREAENGVLVVGLSRPGQTRAGGSKTSSGTQTSVMFPAGFVL